MNVPIKTASRGFVFGRVESGDEVLGAGEWVAASVEGDKANDGDDGDDTRDGDMDGTTSSGGIDSMRVNEALLAGGSQHMHQSQRTQNNNLLVSSKPPTKRTERPNGLVRRRCQCGGLQDHGRKTYLCCPSHPSSIQSLAMKSLAEGINVKEP